MFFRRLQLIRANAARRIFLPTSELKLVSPHRTNVSITLRPIDTKGKSIHNSTDHPRSSWGVSRNSTEELQRLIRAIDPYNSYTPKPPRWDEVGYKAYANHMAECVRAYMALRKLKAQEQIELVDMRAVITIAAKRRDGDALQTIANDIYFGAFGDKAADVARILLVRLAVMGPDLVATPQLLFLVSISRPLIHEQTLKIAFSLLSRSLPSGNSTEEGLTILARQLIEYLPAATDVDPYAPGPLFGPTFAKLSLITIIIAERGANDAVISILSALISGNKLPSTVLGSVDLSEAQDFVAGVTGIFLRASLHWQLTTHAASLFTQAFPRRASFEDGVSLARAFTQPRTEGLPHSLTWDAAATVVRTLLAFPSLGHLPDEILHSLLTTARQCNRSRAATRLYEASVASGQPVRPAPPILTAPWLLQKLMAEGGNEAAARGLACAIAAGQERLPIHLRAGYVAALAEAGFATQARREWERYVIFENVDDARAVAGSAPVAVRLVKLFAKLARKQVEKMEKISSDSQATASAPVSTSGVTNRDTISDVSSQEINDVQDSFNSPRSSHYENLDPPPHMPHLIDVGIKPPPLRPSPRLPKNDQNIPNAEDLAEDLTLFAHRVLNAFLAEKQPLAQASHFDCTSLARACFAVGRMKEGYAALAILLSRRQVPDMYDANVALLALAQHEPREAAIALRHMARAGLPPDPVALGTIIHFALARDDVVLAQWLISHSLKLNMDGARVSMKMMDSVIRASVGPSVVDPRTRRRNLRWAVGVVESLVRSGHAPRTALGRFCATQALHAGMPRCAFRFWDAVVRGRVEWDNTRERKLRERISMRLRTFRRHVDGSSRHRHPPPPTSSSEVGEDGQSVETEVEKGELEEAVEGSLNRALYALETRG